jgi:DnaK suppressor protein
MIEDTTDIAALRARLVAKLAEIEGASEASAENRRPVELDQTTMGRLSRMDAMQGQAMAKAAERMRGQEAARIRAALKRIDEGDYGYCSTCGEEIAPKRLAVDPTIPTCIGCASGGGP